MPLWTADARAVQSTWSGSGRCASPERQLRASPVGGVHMQLIPHPRGDDAYGRNRNRLGYGSGAHIGDSADRTIFERGPVRCRGGGVTNRLQIGEGVIVKGLG